MFMALALAACRSRPADPPAADAGGAATPIERAAVPDCEVLLSENDRELMLPGFTMKQERACPTCGPLCSFRSDADPDIAVSIAWDCNARHAQADVHALMAPTLQAGGVEVPALGRAAVRRAPAQGMSQVLAWDDDTPCALVITWLGGETERAVEVARAALIATTPAVLDAGTANGQAPDAGDADAGPTGAP
ncbi:putative lipoprotein [Corallococcus macrosporus]|uniref:Putative lipoprotein n=1 Tax=Myxococcus fulvus (strain ATCC BAA-855 / HW-1) TaxID=483219 RepID=F8CDX6_MYXFH|nr:putative lipoprotein [Corallococcus macrosporus]